METVKVKEVTRYRDGGTIVYQDDLNRLYYLWYPTGKIYNQMPKLSVFKDKPDPWVQEIPVILETYL